MVLCCRFGACSFKIRPFWNPLPLNVTVCGLAESGTGFGLTDVIAGAAVITVRFTDWLATPPTVTTTGKLVVA